MRYLDLKLGYHCNNNCVHCIIVDQCKVMAEDFLMLNLPK